jgi:5-methylthioadenosine/S-adenosylhomocysteine deaminase
MLIKNCEILSCSDGKKWETARGDIEIRNGTITGVGGHCRENDHETVIDGENKIAMPGLVNAHTHSYGNLVKTLGENHPFESWVYYAFLAGCFSEEDLYLGVMLGAVEMIRSGVTTCLDQLGSNEKGIEAAIRAYLDAGMRVAVAPMVSDKAYYQTLPVREGDLPENVLEAMRKRATTSLTAAVELCEALINRWHGTEGDLISIHPGPSGPQRCSDALLIALHELAERDDVHLHTHLLESKIQLITALDFYKRSMVEHLEMLGILSSRWAMAHAVWLTNSDIEILRSHDISIIHNPESNLTLGNGICPLNIFRKAGVNIALGTDGSNCGGNQNLFRAMALAAMLSKVTSPDYVQWPEAGEVLTMATAGGANALGLGNITGALEPGKKADLVLIDSESPHLTPRIDLANQLVYSESGQSVDTVVIQGRVVMEGKEIKSFDEQEILRRVVDRFPALKARLQPAIEQAQHEIPFVNNIYRREILREVGIHRTAHWPL